MAKATKGSALAKSAQQAQQPAPSTAPEKKPEQVLKGTGVKALAKELGIAGKKLRRYLRANKFQRSGKLWDLSSKQVQDIRTHFTKPAPTETSNK